MLPNQVPADETPAKKYGVDDDATTAGPGAGEVGTPSQSTALFQALAERNTDHSNPCIKAICRFWRFNFHPHRKFHVIWDMYILILVFWSSMWEPYKAAYLGSLPVEGWCEADMPPRDTGMAWWEWVVDICFYADIVMNFWTGFERGYEVVMEKREIVKNYMAGWFWVDFIATVEWDLIITATMDGSGSPPPIVSLFRLIKVARLLRASRLINRLTQSWTLHTGFIDAITFFIYVLICAHILACSFWLFPAVFNEPSVHPGLLVTDGELMDTQASLMSWRLPFEYDIEMTDASWSEPSLNTYIQGTQDGVSTYDCLSDALAGCEGSGSCSGVVLDSAGVYTIWQGVTNTSAGDTAWMFTPSHAKCIDKAANPQSKWIQSLYWSLTTMTTIGYGDRLPQTTPEFIFCMLCEIIGMSFFALLLTQINNLNDVMSKQQNERNDIKNEVVGFISHNGLGDELIDNALYFLNFTAASISSLAFDGDSEPWTDISPPLLKEIKMGLFTEPLKRVKFLGWSLDDQKEKSKVKMMFEKTDTDGGGALDKNEIMALVKELKLDLTEEQMEISILEMDPHKKGDIGFVAFESWWFHKKNNRPRSPPAPLIFVQELAYRMKVKPASPLDVLTEEGSYGNIFNIILTGGVDIIDCRHGVKSARRAVCSIDSNNIEPVWGISTALPEEMRLSIMRDTVHWKVIARQTVEEKSGFCDIGYIEREALIETLTHYWDRIESEDGVEEHQGFTVFMNMARSFYDSKCKWDPTVRVEHDVWNHATILNVKLDVEATLDEKIQAVEGRLKTKMDTVSAKMLRGLAQVDEKLDSFKNNSRDGAE